jgi:hypothetical protein
MGGHHFINFQKIATGYKENHEQDDMMGAIVSVGFVA